MQGQMNVKENAFIQFVHDNADWNVETLDGKGTFHSLGGCETIIPGSYLLPKKPLPCLTRVTESEIAAEGKIEVLDYPYHAMDGMKFFTFAQPNPRLTLKLTESSKINCYWMFHKYVSPSFEKGWNGYMEYLTKNCQCELSVINFLPFIHAYPSEYNKLYTALNQSVCEARRLKMTFDQPLYLKARDILGATKVADDIAVFNRLGGFHTLMSFLGSIGFIMKDSGLAGVLSSVYGENTVKQIFSGHQYSRAVRAHTLVLLALSKIIFRRAEDKCENVQECVQFLTEYSFMSPEDIEELQKDDYYRTITAEFEKELERIEGLNSTCKLWVQYCRRYN